uniref:Nuclear pore complex protein GP210 isoform X2 n=1 Tax=Rhizophora mucronata TaxID=61149 RepID=A0A2P2KNU5_RHIMU
MSHFWRQQQVDVGYVRARAEMRRRMLHYHQKRNDKKCNGKHFPST